MLNLELLLTLLAWGIWHFLVLCRGVTHRMWISPEVKYKINRKLNNCCSLLLCFSCFYLPLVYLVLNITWLSSFLFLMPLVRMSHITREEENWIIRVVRSYLAFKIKPTLLVLLDPVYIFSLIYMFVLTWTQNLKKILPSKWSPCSHYFTVSDQM